MLGQGADVNALADSPFERGGESVHCTALQVAVATKQPEVAQLLLERGADPNIGDHEAKITPLMYTKCVKCQQLLLDAKADITVFDQLFGRNAFHWACYDGKVIANSTARLLSVFRSLTSVLLQVDLVELLVRVGSDMTLRTRPPSEKPQTGREIAQEKGHTEVVER